MLTQKQRFIALFVFLVGLYAIFEFTGLRQNFSLEYLRQVIEVNPVTGVFVFVIAFCVGNLVQLPGWIFLVAAVLTLGKVYGGLLTYLTAVISCLFTFYVVKTIGGEGLREIKNRRVQKIFERLDSHPVSSVFLARVFFQTAPPMNFALGLSGVRGKHHFLGTIAGLPFPITIHCVFFDFLASNIFNLA